MFSRDNWSYSCYKNSTLQVIISLGGVYQEETQDALVEYCVTVLADNQDEVFQRNFNDLDLAIDFINERYNDWDFEEVQDKSSDGGCGSCEAH